MKLASRVVLRLAAGAAALAAFARTTRAQLYPSRPITIIVPVPPGGVADPIARILADHLTVALGQPVVVENVTGAGGSIGVGRAARAAPDGYTISIGNWLSHVGASAVYPVQYDVLKDFAQKHGIDLSTDPVAMQRIKDLAERVKIDLSARAFLPIGNIGFGLLGAGSVAYRFEAPIAVYAEAVPAGFAFGKEGLIGTAATSAPCRGGKEARRALPAQMAFLPRPRLRTIAGGVVGG